MFHDSAKMQSPTETPDGLSMVAAASIFIAPLAALFYVLAASMAACAIVDVADTLLGMFSENLWLLVLVTAKAAILAKCSALMASDAGRIMVSVEPEIAVVVKMGRFPPGDCVAMGAA